MAFKQRGIGLLELMLVLLIIGMIIFTATRYFTIVSRNLKVAQAEEMINNIVNAAYKWQEGNPNFMALSSSSPQMGLTILINADFIPATYVNTPWMKSVGSATAIQVYGGWTEKCKNNLFINMYNVPLKDCNNLVSKMKKNVEWYALCSPPGSDPATFRIVFGPIPPTSTCY